MPARRERGGCLYERVPPPCYDSFPPGGARDEKAMNTRKVVITHALRSPMGALHGAFAGGGPVTLGVEIVQALLRHAGLKPSVVEQVWFGQARPDPEQGNVAGVVAYRAGIPVEAPAFTINVGAASGLQAILTAARAVLSGEVEVALAGGVDCSSSVPRLAEKGMEAQYGPGGLWCALLQEPCGMAAEHLAAKFHVSTGAMLEFARLSRERARTARVQGSLDAQIAPVHVRTGKDISRSLRSDEYLLTPPDPPPGFPFRPEGGLVPGPSVAPLADGAAAVLLMSKEEALRRGFQPLVQVGMGRAAGEDPRFSGLAAVSAARKVLETSGIPPSSLELVEVGETFAVDALLVMEKLGLDRAKVNVLGGDLALGHPMGATGARMVVSLAHEMARRDYRKGMVALSTCGGLGLAATFFRFPLSGTDLFAMPPIEERKNSPRKPGGPRRKEREGK